MSRVMSRERTKGPMRFPQIVGQATVEAGTRAARCLISISTAAVQLFLPWNGYISKLLKRGFLRCVKARQLSASRALALSLHCLCRGRAARELVIRQENGRRLPHPSAASWRCRPRQRRLLLGDRHWHGRGSIGVGAQTRVSQMRDYAVGTASVAGYAQTALVWRTARCGTCDASPRHWSRMGVGASRGAWTVLKAVL